MFKGQHGQLSQGQSNQRHSWTVDAKGGQKGSLDAVHVLATAGDTASKAQPVQVAPGSSSHCNGFSRFDTAYNKRVWVAAVAIIVRNKACCRPMVLSEPLFVRVCGNNDL